MRLTDGDLKYLENELLTIEKFFATKETAGSFRYAARQEAINLQLNMAGYAYDTDRRRVYKPTKDGVKEYIE